MGFTARRAAVASAAAAAGAACLLATGTAPAMAPARSAAAGGCHITLRHSIGGMPATSVRFVNRRSTPVGVYWLNFQGFLAYYETLPPGASFNQSTFRSNAWVMLSPTFNCVGYFVTGTASQYTIR